MLSRIAIFGLAMVVLLVALAAADKPPAQFISAGEFSGGVAADDIALTGVRFGHHTGYTRMVLDLSQRSDDGALSGAPRHPVYRVAYREYPYRLVVSLQDVWFDPGARVGTKPALPFSVVTREDGTIKEMQVYLAGPSEFKVIEIDDPAKLSIDVRPDSAAVPTIYTVQVTGSYTASEAYALVERGEFPAGFEPQVLVLGDIVVIEQAFPDAGAAAAMDADLRGMGYASVINERRGDELPQL
jgi:hypothetical protein